MRSTAPILALLTLAACHSGSKDPQPEQPDVPSPVVEPDDGKPVAPREVKLSPLERDVTVPVGATLLYSFKSHGSVGYGAIQQVGDSAVVRYVRTDMNYEQPDKVSAGMPGADAATGVFVFEAVAAGTTTVTVDEQFRGTTEQSTTFTITVTPQ
jgi:hypothetical protein